MASIQRIRVSWDGITNLPGLSTFYAPDGDTTAVAALHDFFTDIASIFPAGLSWTIPNTGDFINDATGALGGTWTQTGGGVVAASGGAAAYAAGTGARVRWFTPGIVNGRRVRGSTFLCPVIAAVYETNGTLITTTVTLLQNEANDLVANSSLLIWSPPFAGSPGVAARAGSSHAVESALVPDKVTSLRTRRN